MAENVDNHGSSNDVRSMSPTVAAHNPSSSPGTHLLPSIPDIPADGKWYQCTYDSADGEWTIELASIAKPVHGVSFLDRRFLNVK